MMIVKILKIIWLPIVMGVWFAIWATLTPGVVEQNPMLATHSIVCALVGALWVMVAVVLRLRYPDYLQTQTEQLMFDTTCYPLLVLGLLSLMEVIYTSV